MRRELHEANRISWNAATVAHNSHKGDQAGFLRNGGTTLFPEEMELCGDLTGQRVVHLQCNAGQDTLGLARLGGEVVGVDISDEAVAFARRLSDESGIPATFVRSDVYDWLAQPRTPGFDTAFCSYGALPWLSDITAWASGVKAALRPGGRLVLVEFHPIAMMYNADLALHYPYFNEGRPSDETEGVHDYVALSGAGLVPSRFEEGVHDFKNTHPSYGFYWGVGDVVTALAQAGFTVEQLCEYPYANGCRLFTAMRELPGRRFTLPEGMPVFPLMWGLVARRR
ncbi:MAG: class I SAM-dependent methyltransferase [Myxococcales bacterium]|nr:class I SAM-dependent methyltransferase [Myxococcales bacterium]